MAKIFIGNIAQEAENEELEALFTPYGTVTECAKFKNYAFVHMEDRKSATKAIRELHGHKLHGRPINVEPSRGKNQGPVKLHIANVEKGHDDELRALFEEYGDVSECAIIKNFAFVHMPNGEEAMDAIKGLDNMEFQGKRIHVQMSRNRPRGGEEEEEYPPPPRGGFYPPRPYPGDHHPDMHYRGRMHGYPPPPPPPPPRRPAYPEQHGYGERDNYNVVDYYEKYRARPYAAAPYAPAAPPSYPAPPSYATPPTYAPPSYMDRRPAPVPPPPPPAASRERPYDPYGARAMAPPPLPASAGTGPASSYYARDRSPIRRTPLPAAPPPAGNGYSYERSRLSPVPRTPMYAVPRPRDPYGAPPPPRYAGY
ncbi:hypothetical protein CRUP_001458 [Coryphaenoides rupestris]|nr:hypothetical protein CRUP_001458 [Coryphaenoides rupestris]